MSVEIINELRRLGWTYQEIADRIGVSMSTVFRWKKEEHVPHYGQESLQELKTKLDELAKEDDEDEDEIEVDLNDYVTFDQLEAILNRSINNASAPTFKSCLERVIRELYVEKENRNED